MDYEKFLEEKTQLGGNHGFEPIELIDCLKPLQKHLIDWAVRKGRAAILADCGLGKTLMEFSWADNVVRHTNGNVLLAAPLAVAHQMVRDAEKFGFTIHLSRDGSVKPGINITNYQQLHKFSPEDFQGMVCDESSVLKNFKGKTKTEVSVFMRKMRFRLLATATAAPNDYIELGTSSEALGYLGHMDMLNRFFKNNLNNSATGRCRGEVVKWRFKGHAEIPFWRWVCSWARAVRKPSDLGFSDEGYILPPLVEQEHTVKANTLADGFLFAMPAVGMDEQRDERKRTIRERCEKVASLVNGTGQPAFVMCHLDDEGDELEEMIPGAIQISGRDDDESKEAKLIAFADGNERVLVSKPKIAAFGLNFQHCNHVTTFPSHSWEQYYQLVRRCWRFGQTRPVTVDVVSSEGEIGVLKNLQRKAEQAERMFTRLVAEMNNAQSVFTTKTNSEKHEIPSWITPIN